jgi:hypothetical protein
MLFLPDGFHFVDGKFFHLDGSLAVLEADAVVGFAAVAAVDQAVVFAPIRDDLHEWAITDDADFGGGACVEGDFGFTQAENSLSVFLGRAELNDHIVFAIWRIDTENIPLLSQGLALFGKQRAVTELIEFFDGIRIEARTIG